MKNNPLGPSAYVAGLLLLISGVSSGQSGAATGEVDRLVAQAKQAGRSTVSIPSPAVMLALASSVDDLPDDNIVLARPIAFVVALDARHDVVTTWYKLRIERDLSRHPISAVPAQQSANVPVPARLLPILPDEFVLSERGGTILVDGVEVRSGNDPTQFLKLDRSYLLFLFGLDKGSRVAYLSLDRASSVFVLRSNGEFLDPVYRDNSRIRDDLRDRFHDSLTELGTHLKERP